MPDYKTEPCSKNKSKTDTQKEYAAGHVHMYICTHMHMHTYMHAYLHICMHAHIHACVCTYMHACAHTCIHAYYCLLLHTHPSWKSLSESFPCLVLHHFHTVQRISSKAWFKDLIHLPPSRNPSQAKRLVPVLFARACCSF